MPEEGFEQRLDRINRIATAVGSFDNPVLQEAAFHYLIGNGGGTRGHTPTSRPTSRASATTSKDEVQNLDTDDKPASTTPAKKTQGKSAGKKQSFDFDKSIDFYTASGGTQLSFKEFVEAHKPKTLLHKVTVAVYWLSREAQVPQVSIDQVYTAFKTIGWPIPPDLVNTAQQAGTKNYIDSKKRDDIRLTTHGENLVEHDLAAGAT